MKTKLNTTEIVAITITLNCLLSLNGHLNFLNYIQIPLTIIADVLAIKIYWSTRKNRKVRKLNKLENAVIILCGIGLITSLISFSLNMFIK